MSRDAKIACNFCGRTEEDDGNFKHKDWCKKIPSKIYDRFHATFKEIYNIIELSFDKEKVEIAKSLIGHVLMETRNDCTELVVNYFKENSKL